MALESERNCYYLNNKPFCTYYMYLGRWRVLDSPVWVYRIGFYSLPIALSVKIIKDLPKWLDQLMEFGDIDDT